MYKKARAHFKKSDNVLYRASLLIEVEEAKTTNDLFSDIIRTIIGQQLSGKAADTIFGRYKGHFGSKILTPQRTLSLPEAKARESGLSRAKYRAIMNLSEKIIAGTLDLERLNHLPDSDVLDELIKVKGIGPWTAEMVLMFSLGRPDVFSNGDLVLRKELARLYGLKKIPNNNEMISIAQKWSPYRTYAARILWKIGDQKKLNTKNPVSAKQHEKKDR